MKGWRGRSPVVVASVTITVTIALAGCERIATSAPKTTSTAASAPTVSSNEATGASETPRFSYPSTDRDDHIDRYHGIEVADPYRWLEEGESPRTRAWVAAQNKVTFGYLKSIGARDAIRRRLTALWDYERWGVPSLQGPRYAVSKNDGLQAQSVLYTLDSLDGSGKVLLDPNTMSRDGTVALAATSFSPKGDYMAYGVSDSGSDWQVWRVRNVATAEDTSDLIQWIKFTGVSWTKDGKGFYYARYDAPTGGGALAEVNERQTLYYHRLGTPQSVDPVIYARPEHPKWGFSPEVTDDGRYLVISVRLGTERNNSIVVQDLSKRGRVLTRAKTPPATQALRPGFTAHWELVGNDGPVLWFTTDAGAPKSRLVAIDVRHPETMLEVIPESTDTLRYVKRVGGRFVASYLSDAHAKLVVYETSGALAHEVALPGIGSVTGFTGEPDDEACFFSFSSFTRPPTVYRLDPKTGQTSVWREPKVDFDPTAFEVNQVFYASKDGTKIPMFVVHAKGLTPRKDAPRPTYLYGYGGFNIPVTPRFSPQNIVWLEMGGVYASANLRGGGEYGEAWHRAGTKLSKQNVFDDFIAAAEYLVSSRWTSSAKLAIGGRSNGGLLVGAAITQRPNLFAAALPGVGVMDMLRFDEFTIGWAWRSDYGDKNDAAQFSVLRGYSPYHNLHEDTGYPATLVYTADHDDRVVPAHSYKFTAALQHAHDGDAPVMIRIDTKAGHGAGKPTGKRIEEWTDLWGFLVDNLDMTVALPQ
ncbi:MAG: S9 family peptidase [Nannocystaceae bacterium]|nr:S9 family peptidase [Nannocystaceae bacterium]